MNIKTESETLEIHKDEYGARRIAKVQTYEDGSHSFETVIELTMGTAVIFALHLTGNEMSIVELMKEILETYTELEKKYGTAEGLSRG